jgi:hypothetical protein
MLDAVRGVNTSGARKLQDWAFYDGDRAILNHACGWSDGPITAVMDRGQFAEMTPDTTWLSTRGWMRG